MQEVPPPGLVTNIPDAQSVSDAPPWLGELLGSVREMRGLLTDQMVTRDQFERYHAEYSTLVATTVEEAVAPIKDDLALLRERVSVLENTSAHKRSASAVPRSNNDPAYKRIVFRKIPEGVSAEDCLKAIEVFMEKHFKHVRVRDIANFYRGPFPLGRTLSSAAYVEFSNSDVRREVLARIGGAKKGETPWLKCEVGGKVVEIKPAMSENAMQRNSCLRKTADLLKADPRCEGKTVKVEFVGKRGVTVDKVFAFTQGISELQGKFSEQFADLAVP